MTVEKKLGIFICEGCRIGQSLKMDELSTFANTELQPVLCHRNNAFCSQQGIKDLVASMDKNNLDGALLAGCGKGTKDDVFGLENGVSLERVNLREMVAWTMDPGQEDMQMAAEDYLRMGMAGLRQKAQVKPFILDDIAEDILVVGGGIAGLRAAVEGANAGYSIHMVERDQTLGGWSSHWKKQIPFDQPFQETAEPVAGSLIEAVTHHDKIHIYTGAEIVRIEGQPGAFEVVIKAANHIKLKVGSIVTATGWKPYDPEVNSLYGLGEIPGVITSIELERQVKENELQEVESVLFLLCAGSRDKDHLPYCSSVCCGVSMKQVAYIRERNPEAVIYILYKDIRTVGFQEEFYKKTQDDPGIIFIKGTTEDIQPISKGDKNAIKINIQDALLSEEVSVEVQQVVLAVGMVPNNTEALKLAYRLGEGIPELKYAFPDSHFICFPYETRRTGIYAAGAVRAPMDIPSAMDDGAGAMMKAIQVIEASKRGEAVHPRSGDQSFPDLYLERCTDCKRCTEECPFGTYDETASGTPVVHPNRCRRCGICLGACPERIISFADYSITMISEMIKSIHVPDEFEEKPRVLVFVCENDALPALEMAVRNGKRLNPFIRIIPVRCLGSINRIWISDALSKGYDGILQIGCKPGDDYQCHFIQGSELNEQRSEIFEETLNTMMLEPERIRTRFVEITDYEGIIDHIEDYMEEIDLVGPNPFKEM